jgi:hypothetical protein
MGTSLRAIQDRWCARLLHLIRPVMSGGPAQMAIPLQMEFFLNSWSLQQERVQRCKSWHTYEGVDLESESQ